MKILRSILQRISDWRNERRLQAVRKRLATIVSDPDAPEKRRLWDEFVEIHNKRSSAAVARMERARGLR